MEYSLKDLIKKNLLFEGRKEDAKEKYDQVPERIFDIFVEGDPSGNHKYIDWLMKKWSETHCINPNSYRCRDRGRANTLINNIKFFHQSPHKYDTKDINSWNTLDKFNSDSVDAKHKLTKGELKKQATKHYETDRYLIVEPHSHPASCFYGGGTQWCTTSRNYPAHFESYNKNNSLIYFINKKTGKKRAFLTPLNRPLFGPNQYNDGELNWLYAGEREYNNYRGEIFTETDRHGRSFAGIPIEARIAMQEAHKEKTKKWVKTLDDTQVELKAKIMRSLDMEGVPVVKRLSNFTSSPKTPILPEVTYVNTFTVIDDVYGNVEEARQLYVSNGCTEIKSVKKVHYLYVKSDKPLNLGSINEVNTIIIEGPISSWGDVKNVGLIQIKYPDFDLSSLNQINVKNITVYRDFIGGMMKKLVDDKDIKIQVNNW